MYRVRVVGILTLVALILAACGGTAVPSGGGSTPVAATGGVFAEPVPAPTFEQVKQAIDALYTSHPSINSFVVQSVTYNPETRDKVLKICSEGSIAANAQELEAQKVSACAPLIFFFYNYGRQNAVPEAVDVARQLYGYAMTGKSADTRKGLTDLLQSWSVK